MSRKSLLKLLHELFFEPEIEAFLAHMVEITGESRETLIEKCIQMCGREILMEMLHGVKPLRFERIQAEMARLGLAPKPKER